MMNALMIEYGTESTTVVYIVNGERKDIIAMPVLFPENRFAMAKEAWALVNKQ